MSDNEEHARADETSAESPDAPLPERGDRTRRLLTPLGHPGVDRGRSMVRRRRKKWPRYVAAIVICIGAAGLCLAAMWMLGLLGG